MSLEESQINSIFTILVDRIHGLQLSWNFNGLMPKNVYFKHLFIVDEEDKNIANEFIGKYYDKMKNGDLFATLSTLSDPKRINWTEKSGFNPQYKIRAKKPNDYPSGIQETVEWFLEKNGETSTIILNIVSSLKKFEEMTKKIQTIRSRCDLNFIINVFGEHPNKIDFDTGVNTFTLQDNVKTAELCSFLRWYYSQIVIKKAEIDVTCLDGEMSSQKNTRWKNCAFNCMKRQFYGIMKHQIQDSLNFICQSRVEPKITLRFRINYTLLNGNSYHSCKEVVLDPERNMHFNRTVNPDSRFSSFEFHGMSLNKNPFETTHSIWCKKREGVINEEEEESD